MNKITVKGARTHNLKNIDIEIPKNKIVVITGLSGSGKSSLAFDTIYAEGQRRYVESLSAYARQFLELMEKPDVDSIEGLSPAIAIQQHTPSKNPRSTVGTTTEIYDYLRLLYAKIGKQHCHICGSELRAWPFDSMINDIKTRFSNKKIKIKSPLVRGRIGTYEELFDNLRKKGYVKVEIDNKTYDIEDIPKLDRYKKHTISIIIDEFLLDDEERLKEGTELALKESDGYLEITDGKYSHLYTQKNACPKCNIGFQELEPRLFSFNSPYGACPKCSGLGFITEIDPKLAINFKLSIDEGAIVCWENPITTRTHRWKNSWRNYYQDIIYEITKKYKIKTSIPFEKLSKKHQDIILYGDGKFEGVINNLKRRYEETESEFVKTEIYNKYIKEILCPECKGKRLKPQALSVFVNGKNIAELTDMTISEIKSFFNNIKLNKQEQEISRIILKEINSRLDFLLSVGLDYLTLSRYSQTLSGGEAQRIQLATQVGSRLSGVLYVLDEPTIGLHQKDNHKLINTLRSLRDLDNTLLIVEHDETTINNADYLIELGPGAGIYGGDVVFKGTLDEMKKDEKSLTGAYLSGRKKVISKTSFRKPSGKYLEIYGASQFNLKNINLKVPLGLFNVICGVSGSGKSTLLYEIIYKGIMKKLNPFFKEEPGKFKKIKGIEYIDKVILVDQSPIGKTSRSNPATYVGFFDEIRKLFAMTPQARMKGYTASRFSFNLKGGRCENCKGEGYIKIQMQFLPDVYIKCEECDGKRFNKDTLDVRYKGKNIYEILEMSVTEAYDFFKNIPQIEKKLSVLKDVGLEYIKLGQSSTTLSGGESQRIKLAYELSKRSTGKTLYILDEPTTGLHFQDVEKLLKVLNRLVEAGNTIIVIEHNPDVIRASDWIIELGPEGGPKGGYVIYEGPLQDIYKSKTSITKDYI